MTMVMLVTSELGGSPKSVVRMATTIPSGCASLSNTRSPVSRPVVVLREKESLEPSDRGSNISKREKLNCPPAPMSGSVV